MAKGAARARWDGPEAIVPATLPWNVEGSSRTVVFAFRPLGELVHNDCQGMSRLLNSEGYFLLRAAVQH